MAEKFTGQGTLVAFSNDGFTSDNNTIDCVVSVTLPGPSVEDVDVTCIAAGVKDYRSGRQQDFEDAEVEYRWDPLDTVHAGISARVASGAQQTFKVTVAAQGSQANPIDITFSGYFKSNGGTSFGAEDPINRTATIKVNSDLTIVEDTP